MNKNSVILTTEDLMNFTDAQLEEAKAYYEAEIEKVKSSKLDTRFVINNDVNSRTTPELLRETVLKPLVYNLSLVQGAINNRKDIMKFLTTPDPDLEASSPEVDNKEPSKE